MLAVVAAAVAMTAAQQWLWLCMQRLSLTDIFVQTRLQSSSNPEPAQRGGTGRHAERDLSKDRAANQTGVAEADLVRS
ncbi:unnamed protein product [Boreogadus saida]